MCFGETDSDQGSDSDEAYVILGAVTPGGGITIRSQIYEDVDAGESRSDWLEIYRGVPGGLTLSTLLMEHDEGDPDKYETAMKAAVASAFTVVGALLTLIPVVGPVIATVAEPLLNAVAPTVGAELSNLNTGDDQLGQVTLALSAKQMVVLAARAPVSTFNGIAYKLETPLLSADGASYKAYFNLTLA